METLMGRASKYPPKFREQTVALVLDGNCSARAMARELGIIQETSNSASRSGGLYPCVRYALHIMTALRTSVRHSNRSYLGIRTRDAPAAWHTYLRSSLIDHVSNQQVGNTSQQPEGGQCTKLIIN